MLLLLTTTLQKKNNLNNFVKLNKETETTENVNSHIKYLMGKKCILEMLYW